MHITTIHNVNTTKIGSTHSVNEETTAETPPPLRRVRQTILNNEPLENMTWETTEDHTLIKSRELHHLFTKIKHNGTTLS